MRFGYHVSVSGRLSSAISEAVASGSETIQIFPGPPQQWGTPPLGAEEVEEFNTERQRAGIDPVLIHSIYLINMAAPDDSVHRRSVGSLVSALKRADEIGARAVVTHIGNHKGKGEEFGLERIAEAVRAVMERYEGKAMLLLETTAGAGTSIGHTFAQFGRVFDLCGAPERLGFCLDTCHVYAAGYDVSSEEGLSRSLEELDRFIGLDRLRILHLNDSRGALGSRVDRHEHIGRGHIGMDGFRRIVNHPALKGLPAIVEVEYGGSGGMSDVELLKSLLD